MLSDTASAWSRYDHYRHYRYDPFDRHYHRHHWHHRHHYHHYPRFRVSYDINDGWNFIKKDRSNTALEIFEDLDNSNPGSGIPKLGYSIAAADTDRLGKSVWAMRRALIFHPGALYQFKPDVQLKNKIKQLVSKFQGRSHGLSEKDAFFMQASLYYLAGDKISCLQAIRLNKDANDTSDSAKNLYYMAENYL